MDGNTNNNTNNTYAIIGRNGKVVSGLSGAGASQNHAVIAHSSGQARMARERIFAHRKGGKSTA